MHRNVATRMTGTHRRGTALIFVLGGVMIVSVIGLGALWAGRSRLRVVQGGADAVEARWYAQSAIELGWQMIRDDPNWRTVYGSGAWITKQTIGRGTCSLNVSRLADADADPLNDDWVILGEGFCGTAVRKIELTLIDGMLLGEWRKKVD